MKKSVSQIGFSLLCIVLFIGIVLTRMAVISVDWLSLFFVLSILICYLTRIDARYLILFGLFLLWLVPFLLSFGLQSLAEQFSIFVYYFLVAGVVTMTIEHLAGYQLLFTFDLALPVLFSKDLLVALIPLVILTVLSFVFSWSALSNAVTLYLSATTVILYLIKLAFGNEVSHVA